MPPPRRDVTRFVGMIRNFLLQRQYVINNKYAHEQVGRDVPAPRLPEGVTHKLSDNYYYTRDGRRESKPCVVVCGESHAMLADGAADSEAPPAAPKEVERRPGMIVPGTGINDVTGRPNGPSPFQ